MAGKLSELMTETGYPAKTSFKDLAVTTLGGAATTAMSNFQFTGMAWEDASLLLDIDPYEEAKDSDLSRTGGGSMANNCNTNTTTLTRTTVSGRTDRLIIKKGSTTIVDYNETNGTITLDGASDTIVFVARDPSPVIGGLSRYTIDASYVGAFNGTIATNPDIQIDVDDQTSDEASFIPGTPILVSNFEYENIENISIDDILVSAQLEGWPDTDDQSIYKAVSSSVMPEMTLHESVVVDKIVKFVNEYYIINDEIGVTMYHDIFVKDGLDDMYRWKSVNDITLNDKMINRFGNEVEIYSKELTYGDTVVVTIDVENVDTYFAHDILVYNAGI